MGYHFERNSHIVAGSIMANRVCLSVALVLGGGIGWASQLPAAWADPNEPKADTTATSFEQVVAQATSNHSYLILHVNATAGDDVRGVGNQMQPLKTITHALSIATPNTLILLAEGAYSADTGEIFPLQLRPGVTVQGAAGPQSNAVVIQGSANYVSPTQGLQNVTILGADRAGLANVTVSNTHPNGTGLWIELGSPTILESAFLRNGSTGIYIAGGGEPVIRNNYFSENGEAGLVIAGSSSAWVQGNVFENTGTGISVAPEATPQILDNRITRNQEGLIIHASAQPVLQNNQIIQNRHNRIVDYAAWSETPTGPWVTQPPPPVLPASPTASVAATLDAATSNQQAAAASDSPSATPDSLPLTTALMPLGEEISVNLEESVPALAVANEIAVPVIPATTAFAKVDLSSTLDLPATLTTPIASLSTATPSAAATSEEASTPTDVSSALAIVIARNARQSSESVTALATSLRPDDDQPSRELANSPEAIEIPIIPPPVTAVAKPGEVPPMPEEVSQTPAPTLPTVEETSTAITALPELPPLVANSSSADTARIIVPSSSIPMGSGGSVPELFHTDAAVTLPADGPPPPPTLASSLGLAYRVLVYAQDETTRSQVQSHVPDAFRVRVDGDTYMQAGAYATLEEARAMAEQLNRQGLRVVVSPTNHPR